MERARYQFVVLGAGISGLTAAYRLTRAFPGEVLVLERAPQVGGLCRKVVHEGKPYDLGSHRIHAQVNPAVLDLIREVAPQALIRNERRGQLRLRDTYIDYPITSVQMFPALGLYESFRCGMSLVKYRIRDKLPPQTPGNDNYESYLLRRAGERAYRLFYEPYARKVWGCEPSLISVTAVKKRVSMTGPAAFLKEVFINTFRQQDKQYYYYLKGGLGSLPEAFADRIEEANAPVLKSVQTRSIREEGSELVLDLETQSGAREVRCETLVSTIPIDSLTRLLGVDHSLSEDLSAIHWTGLRLVYLFFDGPPSLEGESFYYPELKYPFGRVSVPARFSPKDHPEPKATCLICEVPWGDGRKMADLDNASLYCACEQGLRDARVIDPERRMLPDSSFVIDLDKVYPLYVTNWKEAMSRVLEHIATSCPRVFVCGRPGLFLHNNIDHAIEIGIQLADHLAGGMSASRWYEGFDGFQGKTLRD